jgi:hypothetical protein
MSATITNDETGESTVLSDTDLWGIYCALSNGIQNGYFNKRENLQWAESMQNIINELRNIPS